MVQSELVNINASVVHGWIRTYLSDIGHVNGVERTAGETVDEFAQEKDRPRCGDNLKGHADDGK